LLVTFAVSLLYQHTVASQTKAEPAAHSKHTFGHHVMHTCGNIHYSGGLWPCFASRFRHAHKHNPTTPPKASVTVIQAASFCHRTCHADAPVDCSHQAAVRSSSQGRRHGSALTLARGHTLHHNPGITVGPVGPIHHVEATVRCGECPVGCTSPCRDGWGRAGPDRRRGVGCAQYASTAELQKVGRANPVCVRGVERCRTGFYLAGSCCVASKAASDSAMTAPGVTCKLHTHTCSHTQHSSITCPAFLAAELFLY
jgi:hypothetical protein